MTVLITSIGGFYLNQMDQKIVITREVPVNHRLYKKGFRFIDMRGTFYTPEGSVNSRLFGKLDLVEELDRLTHFEEFANTALDYIGGKIKKVDTNQTIYHYLKKMNIVLSGANLGIGYLLLMNNLPQRAALSIMTGLFGLIADRVFPDNVYGDYN